MKIRWAGQHSRRDVAVAVEVLRGAVHDEVDAKRQRLLIDRARERVVDDRCHTIRAARRGHRRDIDAAQRRVDGRLEPHHPGRGRKDRVGVAQLLDRHEPGPDAELRQQIGDEVQRPAVDRPAAHDLVASGEQGQERGRRGGLPAREHERGAGAFERGNLLLDRHHRRVRVSRIEELRLTAPRCSHEPPARFRRRRSSFRRWASSGARQCREHRRRE